MQDDRAKALPISPPTAIWLCFRYPSTGELRSVDPKATSPNSQSPNFLLAVRSIFKKSGLHPFNAKGVGQGDSCGGLRRAAKAAGGSAEPVKRHRDRAGRGCRRERCRALTARLHYRLAIRFGRSPNTHGIANQTTTVMIRARAAIAMITHSVTQIAIGTRFRCMFGQTSRRGRRTKDGRHNIHISRPGQKASAPQ